MKKNNPQIFLSYAYEDLEVAERISKTLRQAGANIWIDEFEVSAGDELVKKITNAISASDYLVLLLSPSAVNSNWVKKEWNIALSNEFSSRDITIIPVLIKSCKIPLSLKDKNYIDLTRNFNEGVKNLVQDLGIAPNIDFTKLDTQSFYSLVIDLLVVLGFSNIDREPSIKGKRVDLRAHLNYKDPFDIDKTDFWVVEIKFYKQDRADLQALQQLADYLHSLPSSYHGLIVTNSHLTSAARSWLQLKIAKQKIDLRVLGGTDLKRLLLKHTQLINKYFNTSRQIEND